MKAVFAAWAAGMARGSSPPRVRPKAFMPTSRPTANFSTPAGATGRRIDQVVQACVDESGVPPASALLELNSILANGTRDRGFSTNADPAVLREHPAQP